MRTGKLAEPALKRSVLRQLNTESGHGQHLYGADCAVLEQESGQLSVYAAAGAVPGFEEDPGKLVISAVNNLAAGGAEPEALLVQALLPPDCEESSLKEAMKKISAQARAQEMTVIGGHTQVSAHVKSPQYLVTGIGKAKKEDCRAQQLLQPGDELVLTKWIALGGTAALARRYEAQLVERYPFPMIDQAKAFEKIMSVKEEARAITHFDSAAMHDLSQGGIFNALWEMAERAGVGLEVDLKKIPVKQETIEICEYFDINPYYLYSAGALLAGTRQGEALVAELSAIGIPAAVIGRVTDGKDRIIRNGEEVRFLDRPKQDEWYRIFG